MQDVTVYRNNTKFYSIKLIIMTIIIIIIKKLEYKIFAIYYLGCQKLFKNLYSHLTINAL